VISMSIPIEKSGVTEDKDTMKDSLDYLSEMFKKQRELQTKLGAPIGPPPTVFSAEEARELNSKFQDYINTMTIACIDELMEALRETPWKPWKRQQAFNVANFRKELIDAWHFLINLSLASGMDAEAVHDLYMQKNRENFKRKEDGY
jgi:hypothetical protein